MNTHPPTTRREAIQAELRALNDGDMTSLRVLGSEVFQRADAYNEVARIVHTKTTFTPTELSHVRNVLSAIAHALGRAQGNIAYRRQRRDKLARELRAIVNAALLAFVVACAPVTPGYTQHERTVTATRIAITEKDGQALTWVYEFSPRVGIMCYATSTASGFVTSCTSVP